MHAVSSHLKRAHLRAVAYGRWVLRKIPDLTPARFDIMYLLRRNSILQGPLYNGVRVPSTQAELARDLGLHRSTVAKMVKRLVEIGWVEQTASSTDRRTKRVRLTPAGLKIVWRVMRRVFRRRFVRRTYERLFRMLEPREHVVEVMRRLVRTLQGVAEYFGGRGTIWYDYGGRVPSDQRYSDLAALERRSRFKWGLVHRPVPAHSRETLPGS